MNVKSFGRALSSDRSLCQDDKKTDLLGSYISPCENLTI